jgi:hypothetical protein
MISRFSIFGEVRPTSNIKAAPTKIIAIRTVIIEVIQFGKLNFFSPSLDDGTTIASIMNIMGYMKNTRQSYLQAPQSPNHNRTSIY